MEKIQTEAVSMLQAGRKAGNGGRTSGTDAAFDRLLKEQNQTAGDRTKDAAVSGKDSQAKAPDAGKEETKPVKESGQKEKPESEEGAVKNGEVVPSELLLQLQESAGQLAAALPEAEAEVLTEQTGEAAATVEIMETVSQAEPLTVPEHTAVQEPSAQTEQPKLSAMAENQAVQAAVTEAKQEAQTEKKVSGQESEGRAEAGRTQAEPLELPEAAAEQKPVKPEEGAGDFGSEARGSTKEQAGQNQQLVGMAQQPLREYAVREPEQTSLEPVRTSEPNLINDVGRAIAQRLPASDGTLTIELEPASLGKMTIRVLYESGKATVSILATSPRTLELLSARAGELASILEERTGQETVVYAEQPESEQPFDERQGEGRQKDREPESREHKERNEQDSFLQQLRLGVI